jgi:hypothetical protein
MSAFTLVYTRAINLPFTSSTVNIPFPNIVKTGVATATATFGLTDTSANFNGIQIGDIVFNNVTFQPAYVTGITDATKLTLSANIFVATNSYTIYQGNNYGCYIYFPYVDYAVEKGGAIEVETIGGDIVTFFNPPAGVLPVQIFKVIASTLGKLRIVW